MSKARQVVENIDRELEREFSSIDGLMDELVGHAFQKAARFQVCKGAISQMSFGQRKKLAREIMDLMGWDESDL